jgi:hypothetical protein
LDAFLQWCCAGAPKSGEAVDLAGIFSSALAERFIPTGKHLQLAHFRLLDDLGFQCDRLPPEEVRSCIERLGKLLLKVDPSTAEGREEVQRELRIFLVAPERQYATTLGSERDLRRAAEARVNELEKRMNLIWKSLFALFLCVSGTTVAYSLGKGDSFLARISNGWLALAATGLVPFAWEKLGSLFRRR